MCVERSLRSSVISRHSARLATRCSRLRRRCATTRSSFCSSMLARNASGTPDAPFRGMEIRRILVPVDFSAQADAAYAYALDLARKLDAKITLLHVFQVPAFAFPDASV